MSYCRFSTDDFQCDVYCYAHVHGGFMTHVAARRYVFNEEIPPRVEFKIENIKEWVDRDKKVSAIRERAALEPIGLTHDGAEFFDQTATEAANRLEQLRIEGYNVPQRAIDALRAESAGESE